MQKIIKLKCDFCEKIFKRILCQHEAKMKKNKSRHIFCCMKCCNLYQTSIKTISTNCKFCNKKVIRMKSHAKKSKTGNFFCNSSCAASFNNKTKRKSRRSKIEKKLFNLLTKEFPQLTIIPNDKTLLDGLEVDIAIPELKLAIEWNGIVHFKPIYGQDKLDRVQNKDTEKLLIASNKDINLIVVNDLVSTDKILKKAFEDIKIIIKNLL